MSAIQKQHPAVVLRSQYKHLRALLAIAMIAVVGLAVAVVALATDDAGTSGSGSAQPAQATSQPSNPNTRYDGGPEEGTRGPSGSPIGAGPGAGHQLARP
jgi:hypothetical protein